MALCPGDTTEWDDIQRKFGNLPPLEKEVLQRELDERFVESADFWLQVPLHFACFNFFLDLHRRPNICTAMGTYGHGSVKFDSLIISN